MSQTERIVAPDADELALTIARRLVSEIETAQGEHGSASIVLTGGTIGTKALAAINDVDTSGVDWSAVDIWWGDERFVPGDDSERNERQARDAVLDALDPPTERVHAVGSSDAFDTADDAAAAYAQELEASAPEGAALPRFDVLMLGVGPDAHVASLFPELDGIRVTDRTVIGVDGAPKPPPKRVSLTLPTINSARQVWLVVAGQDKAGAVALALNGAEPIQVPAAGVHGTEATRWFLDEAAAAQLGDDADRATIDDARQDVD